MALTTRKINISLRFPTPQTTATVRFIPDLSAGNGQVLLEKYYDAVLTDAPKTITTASNDEPIVITTSADHGYLTGERVVVSGVSTNTAANGTWTITVLTNTTFELDGSVGNGAGTGGTVASTTLDGTINLPVFVSALSFINYRVQFPRESGVNEHYISVNSGVEIDLSELLVTALASSSGYALDLDSLTDVEIGALSNNQVLMYESATELWKNKPITATSFSLGLTSGSVLFTNGNHLVQDNAQFYWDDSNNRLGIGTNSPQRKLHIVNATSFGQMRLAWDATNYTDLRAGLAAVDGSLYITPSSGGVKIQSTSPSQFEVRYSDSSYLSTTVGATGIVTFDAIGSSGSFVFSDGVTVPNLTATATLLSNGYTEAVFGNAKLKLMDISGYGYLTVKWNETAGDNILNIKVNGGDRTLNLNGDLTVTANNMVDKAEQVAMLVRNDEATTLTVGEVVYVSGASGEHVKVKRALATSDPTSANTLGMVIESIASGADGKIALHGVVTGVNTNAYNEGDALYLSPSVAGGLTTTKPHAPDHMVFVGWVTKKSGNGKIALHIQNGYELEELHDVYITSPAANHFLVYDATVGQTRWENRSPADARTAMGLGTIATQDANNVAITGGYASGLSSIQATGTGTQLNLRYDVDNYATFVVGSAGQLTVTTSSSGFNPTPDVSIAYGLQVGGSINVTGNVSVADAAYGAGWNGSTDVPTKNAVYDKIEALPVVPSLTSGSVVFSSGGTTLSQDNANFFWDDTNNRLGIRTTSPQNALDVTAASSFGQMRLSWDATYYTRFLTTSTGGLSILPSHEGVEIASTASPQFTIKYDASNYYTTTVNSAGLVTFDTTGVAFAFDNGLRIDEVVSGTPQLSLRNTNGPANLDIEVADDGSVVIDGSGLLEVNVLSTIAALNIGAPVTTLATLLSQTTSISSPQLTLRYYDGTIYDLDFQVRDDEVIVTAPGVPLTIDGVTGINFNTGAGNASVFQGTLQAQRIESTAILSRVVSTASSASPTPDADGTDLYSLTALAVNATFGAPTGTPANGQKLLIRIKDNGTARTLNWNAAYVAGGASLPTTTVINKTMHLGFIYNTDNGLNKWMLIAKAEEA